VAPLETAPRVASLGLFAGGVVLLAAHRQVALRIDDTGITFGGSPRRYAATTSHIPWSDITAVVLWRQAPLCHVGVLGPDDLLQLPDVLAGRARMWVSPQVAQVPGLAHGSRAVLGWRLDADRLATAVRHYAPAVLFIDQR
jgi:hypothetical protein